MARHFVIKTDRAETKPKFSIDYERALNPQQFDVVTAPDGAYLVIAGAGTGKTRTLVYRVAYLVETGTPPEQIVLLTFTRRAAKEMLLRASGLLDGRCERVQGGTFHSFCLMILRRFASKIGFENHFSVLDASDTADVIDILRTARGYHQSGKRFPRKNTLQSMFSKAVNLRVSVVDILGTEYPQFQEFTNELVLLENDYARYKREHSLMDYDDLLQHTFLLLEQEKEVLESVSSKCRNVLVDEYQDTNSIQAQLVRQFTFVHGNVMAVGDDAQSIYRFRGADFRNIFAFPLQFSGTRILRLEQNYRSTQPILTLANQVISQARTKYDKQLFTEKTGGDLPAVIPAPNVQYESRFISQVILNLREEGIPLEQIAVLFRSSHISYDLEVELNRCNIPFVKYGGQKLSEAAHIKDVLAHLRVIENPRDAVSWNRILQLLEGIGPKTAQTLIEWILSASDDPFTLRHQSFSPRYLESLKNLFVMLRGVYHASGSVLNQLETIIQYYEPILKRKYFEDYPKRLQDLEHFITVAETFPTRSDLLASLALDPIEFTALDVDPLKEDEKPLVLSTIHSAKGLEFQTVFIIHALEGILPSGYAIHDPDALDEELRLLYVAVTRAKENLFISYPIVQYRPYAGEFFSDPCRFITTIPEEILEPWTLVEESQSLPAPRPATGDTETDTLPF